MGEYRYRGAGFDSVTRGRPAAGQRPRGRDSIFPDTDDRSDRADRQRRWGGGSIHDHDDDGWSRPEDIDRARSEAASRGCWEGRSGSGEGAVDRGQLSQDDDYRRWRDRQIDELDRDYDEYRRHRQQQFDQDFNTFRQARQADSPKSGAQQQQATPSQVSALGNDGGDSPKAVASGQTLGAGEAAGTGKGGSGRSR